MTVVSILNEDCRDISDIIPDDTIDLIVTSPPYKDCDNYTEDLITDVFSECYKVLKNDGLMFVNFGHLAEDKKRPYRVLDLICDTGFNFTETIVWIKKHYRPIQGKRRVNNLFEFIWVFYKKKMPELNRLSIGVPYEDKSNVGRFSDIDLKCPGNVWVVDYETIQSKEQKLHNDRFPVEIPRRCIKLSGKTGSLLDPFAGSGSSLVAGKELGMEDVIGFEINRKNYNIMKKRLYA